MSDLKRTVAEAPTHAKPMNEKLLLLVLAAIQFVVIVDFMIIMPLGPQYMRVFKINPSQFGLIVASYAISAGVAGVAASFVLDRFDRKSALLVLMAGFTIGTFLCAVSPNYPALVASRVVAGGFGGVVGALILSIVGDVIPEQRRGRAMGIVMSSFSMGSIWGLPLGLYLASTFNWHVPFLGLAGLSMVIVLAAARVLPALRGHMIHATNEHPFRKMLEVLSHSNHQMAFVFMAVLTCTGFIIFPYLSTYMVANVGLAETQLPLIYLFGGLATIVSMNLIGRWSDRSGKARVFVTMVVVSLIPIVLFTNLSRVHVVVALAISTVFMVCMSGRMVPAMALMTGSIEPRYRGGFMSINSSVQQLSSGLASFVSGHIMGQTATGELTRFSYVGILSVVLSFLCIYLVRFLAPSIGTPVAVVAEG